MRPWLAWTTGVGLLVAAWVVALITPPEDAAEAPFVTAAAIGEQVSTRTLTATIRDVRVAERVSAGGWEAEGTWIVVDLDIAASLDEEASQLAGASLTVGDRTYRASERPPSLFRASLNVGIPQSGSLAFELPPDATDDTAVLRLSEDDEIRLDALIELTVDLDSVDHVSETELLSTGWARP